MTSPLTIGISSRSLFSLEKENEIFETKGIAEYVKYQLTHENEPLPPGTAFPLIKGLLNINRTLGTPMVNVIVISRNSPETGLRVFNSIESLELTIERGVFTGGASILPYLEAFKVDLFLSRNEEDVQAAIDHGIASAIILDPPADYNPDTDKIRIAFDADAVIFSDESEIRYKTEGLEAFQEYEKTHADLPLPEGPFGSFIKTLSGICRNIAPEHNPFRIAIVTARSTPAHKRVLLTLRSWGVQIDEIFFLGGMPKDEILKSFNAHIFFDDQPLHTDPASKKVPSARVPYKKK